MTGDWADDKAAEVLALILNPGVTLDKATEFMAATFRLVEVQGARRGIAELGERLEKKVFTP